jgi:uncharacterized protein YcbK (DUF882 family)
MHLMTAAMAAMLALANPVQEQDLFTRYAEARVKPAHEAVKMACPGGKPFPRVLITLLEDAARFFHAAVFVNSAYRDPKYNRRIGGAKKSQHMKCRAVDFYVENVPAADLYNWAAARKEIKGLGRYPRSQFIHADVRPTKRRVTWGHDG